MPENPNRSRNFEKCSSCATSEGPGLGPLPTVSHQEVCCLFKVARPGQSAPFLNEGSHKRYDYDGLCKDCPSRKALHVSPIYPPPPSSDAPQGIVALPTGCEAPLAVTVSPSRKRKKIEPRLRTGFKKLTLEIRPRRFKQKLWFGTFTEEEIDRAEDAVNYYMGYNQPYNYPDSQQIFAEKPLEIKFEDLMPSCDQIIQVDGEEELAHKCFARQVKEVIHSVTGKQKKYTQKKNKCRVSEKLESLLRKAPKRMNLYDPIVRSAPGSTTLSDTQGVACPGPEANSQLAASHPMFLPPVRMFTQEDDEISELLRCTTQMYSDELLSNRWGEGMFPLPLDEMFTFPSAIPISGYGESSTLEENGYLTENLWAFQNEDPGFPPE